MDERTKKRYEMAAHFMEQEYGVHLVAFPSKKDKEEAASDIRLGRAMKAALVLEPVNELPF